MLPIRAIYAAAPLARALWLNAAALKEPCQHQVLKQFAVKGIKANGYQLYLAHVLLGALCPSWEQVKGPQWCGCMGDGPACAVALIFGSSASEVAKDPQLFDALLTKVLHYVEGNWGNVGGADMDMPLFDEEDLVPQLCEWVRTGTPAYLANSAAVMHGAFSD